jgi:DNA polymerase elongation subunit (family B)
MGYRNVYYDAKQEKIHLWTWDENGNRITTVSSFEPYLYVESPNGTDGLSIFNTPLKKIKFKNQFDRVKFVEQTPIFRLFHNLNPEQQFLLDVFKNETGKESFNKHELKIFYLDIETYGKDGFSTPEEAKDPINLITVYDSLNKKYYTWGLGGKYIPKNEDETYIKCNNEEILLRKFLDFWESDYPDCVSGWNICGYDIPYIINRLAIIFDDQEAKKLSPVNKLRFVENIAVNKLGRKINRWFIHGISILDYMDIYKTFALGDRESYSLNYIAEYELQENKVAYIASSLADLADSDWNTFVDYNIQDVRLLVKLEDKLKYLKLVRNLSYKGFIPFEKATGKVSLITGAVAHQALKQGMIIPTFNIENVKQKFAGGFVMEPKPGLYEDVVTYDANSLYPNTIITLNISPETKIGKIIKKENKNYTLKLTNGKNVTLEEEKFLKLIEKEKLSVTEANVLYTQKNKGVVPNLIDGLYKERVEAKNKTLEAKNKLSKCKNKEEIEKIKQEIVDNDTLSNVYKVILNSIYGVFSQIYSPLFDIDHAESVTLSGQAVVKKGSEIIYEYLKKQGFSGKLENICIYQDTDSEFFSFKKIFDSKNIKLKDENNNITPEALKLIDEFGEVLNEKINEWANTKFNSIDSRYFFKREKICDVAVLQKKKYYILHILDSEGIKTNKFMYKGLEVAKSILSKEVKNLIKSIIESAIISKDRKIANRLFQEGYEKYIEMSPELIASRKKVNNYEKYENGMSPDGSFQKGTPNHVKSAVNYNKLIEKLNIKDRYHLITSGEKIKTLYCEKNSLNFDTVAFLNDFPKEFFQYIKPDYRKMFQKNVIPPISRVFQIIGWPIPEIGCEQITDLMDLLRDENNLEN